MDAKGFKGVRGWDTVVRQERAVDGLLSTKEADILAAVGPSNTGAAKQLLTGIKADVGAIDAAVKSENRRAVVGAQVAALEKLDRLGVMMLGGKAPFVVPADEASGIPRAYGRSYAEISVQVTSHIRVIPMKLDATLVRSACSSCEHIGLCLPSTSIVVCYDLHDLMQIRTCTCTYTCTCTC